MTAPRTRATAPASGECPDDLLGSAIASVRSSGQDTVLSGRLDRAIASVRSSAQDIVMSTRLDRATASVLIVAARLRQGGPS